MRMVLVSFFLFIGYLLIIVPFVDHMKERPIAIKLGYVPDGKIVKIAAFDYRFMLSEANVIKVLFYFGSFFSENENNDGNQPEYGRMYSQLIQAVKLDPLNQDIYYFAQAMFTWDVGRVREVNTLLDYGMKHRVNDWRLPYWAGFNSAYFLKDYEAASHYFKKAAEMSGNILFTKLAARYFHEAGQSALGVLFLDTMIKGAKDPNVKQLYEDRKQALEASSTIQQAVEKFLNDRGVLPVSLQSLIDKGYIESIPVDPYGGSFFLDENGRIRSTSKFAYAVQAVEASPSDLDNTSGELE